MQFKFRIVKLVHLCSYLRWTDPSCLSICIALLRISRSLGEWKILLPDRSAVLLPIHSSLAPAKKRNGATKDAKMFWRPPGDIFRTDSPVVVFAKIWKLFLYGIRSKESVHAGVEFPMWENKCWCFQKIKFRPSGLPTSVQRDQAPAQLDSLQPARVNWISSQLDGRAVGPL